MTVREQIVDALAGAHDGGREWLTGGEIVRAVQAADPNTNAGSIRAETNFYCINDPSKNHAAGLAYLRNPHFITDEPTMRGKRYRLLTEDERSAFLANPRTDLERVSYALVVEWLHNPGIELPRDGTDVTEVDPVEATQELGGTALLEMHLQDYLHRNWSRHFPDWTIYEGGRGREFRTSDPAVGTIDFLCTDSNGGFVVIETKRNLPDREAVGQLLGYMGWVGHRLAQGRPVRGLLIAGAPSDALRMAISAVPNVELWLYEMAFSVHRDAPEVRGG